MRIVNKGGLVGLVKCKSRVPTEEVLLKPTFSGMTGLLDGRLLSIFSKPVRVIKQYTCKPIRMTKLYYTSNVAYTCKPIRMTKLYYTSNLA